MKKAWYAEITVYRDRGRRLWCSPKPGDGERSGFGEHPASYREVILVPRHGIFPSESQGTFWCNESRLWLPREGLVCCFIHRRFNSTVSRRICHLLVIWRTLNFLNPIKLSVIYSNFLSEFCPGVFVGSYIYLCNITHHLVKRKQTPAKKIPPPQNT